MKYLLPLPCFLLTLFLGCNDFSVSNNSDTTIQKESRVGIKEHCKDSIVLIETVIDKIGNVRVFYDCEFDRLCIMSWSKKDTIFGFTTWVFLRDSFIQRVEPVKNIGRIDGEKLVWENMMFSRNNTLFFSIRDQFRRANVYTAKIIERKWKFLCNTEGSCSIFYSSSGCKVLDEKRDRLLVNWPGIRYDTENDKDIDRIEIYEYSSKGRENIGNLDLEDWEKEQCDSIAILSWYKAYEKIANKEKFNQYLVIPKIENKRKD